MAENPAKGSFREFSEFIIVGNYRTGSRAGVSNSEGSLFYRGQASIISSEHSSGFPSGSSDPKSPAKKCQEAGAWRLQLASYKRRGTGDRGWRSSSDIRSRKCIPRISCKVLCKTEKIKVLFVLLSWGDQKLSTAGPYCIYSIMKYLPAASCCVDKYSEKLKKLIVFFGF